MASHCTGMPKFGVAIRRAPKRSSYHATEVARAGACTLTWLMRVALMAGARLPGARAQAVRRGRRRKCGGGPAGAWLQAPGLHSPRLKMARRTSVAEGRRWSTVAAWWGLRAAAARARRERLLRELAGRRSSG